MEPRRKERVCEASRQAARRNLRGLWRLLKDGSLARAERDRQLAEEWRTLEEEAWCRIR